MSVLTHDKTTCYNICDNPSDRLARTFAPDAGTAYFFFVKQRDIDMTGEHLK